MSCSVRNVNRLSCRRVDFDYSNFNNSKNSGSKFIYYDLTFIENTSCYHKIDDFTTFPMVKMQFMTTYSQQSYYRFVSTKLNESNVEYNKRIR